MSMWIHPAAIMILGTILIPMLKGKVRSTYLIGLALATFASVVLQDHGIFGQTKLLGFDVTFGRIDNLSYIFAFIFGLMSIISTTYALNEKNPWHHVASLVYAGSAIGAVFAGDYVTLFIFWEFMAIASTFLILFRNTDAARKAAYRYILVHMFGGVALLGGFFLNYAATGSMEFTLLDTSGGFTPATALILIGFLINAAVPPFGPWLPDAYPMATVPGAVFMSSFTTKSAVYVLCRSFAGTELLIYLGVVMALWGVVYAVLENDIRRLLAYHIISQVGYMVAAVGIGTKMAIAGACAHAFAHILYKGLLFMGAGSVLFVTGKSKLTELGGLYKRMPWTFFLYMIGAFAISSIPLFSGFVSKSIIVSSAAEEHMQWVWFWLMFASAGTFLHTGLKLPYFTFMGKDSGVEATDPPKNMLIAMGMAAFLCIFIGVYPNVLYTLLPYDVGYVPYTVEHLVFTGEILVLTWLGFYFSIKDLGGQRTISMDTDWFYRKFGKFFMRFVRRIWAKGDDIVGDAWRTVFIRNTKCMFNLSNKFDVKIVDGAVNSVASFVQKTSEKLRTMQTGQLQHYGSGIIIGLLLLLTVIIFFN